MPGTTRHAISLACFFLALFLLCTESFAVRSYHISRPRLGFELEYEYERDKQTGPFLDTDISTGTYSERLDIETDGWLYHPALVEYNLTFSPKWVQTVEEADGGETQRSREFLQGYDADFVFLKYKPYTLTLFGNRRSSTVNNNFTQKSEIETNTYGAVLSLKYPTLPTTFQYTHIKDTQTGFFDSSTVRDEYRLNMRYDKHMGNTIIDMYYLDAQDTSGIVELGTTLKESTLQNIYLIPGKRSLSVLSLVKYIDRETDTYRERGVNWSESLTWRHRKNLSTDYGARYESYQLEDDKHREYSAFNFSLNHLLYENLTTTVSADATKNHNESGQERTYGSGLDWNYVRRIPGGTVTADMSHTYRIFDRQPNLNKLSVEIRDEVHLLKDNDLTVLNNSSVIPSSIVVAERKGALRGQVYREGFDYDVTSIGEFTYISRTPGTAIPNSTEVLVDYEFVSSSPYDFSVTDRSYGLSLSLWKSLRTYYLFTRSRQRFLRGVEPDTLRIYNRQTVGMEYRWRWSTTLVEYNDIDSTEVPSESWKITETLLFRPSSRVFLSLSADTGRTRYKNLEEGADTDTFSSGRVTIQAALLPRLRLIAEGFIRDTSGIINDTRETGFTTELEGRYNIYHLDIRYTFRNEEDLTGDQSFKNHLVMVRLRRDIF